MTVAAPTEAAALAPAGRGEASTGRLQLEA